MNELFWYLLFLSLVVITKQSACIVSPFYLFIASLAYIWAGEKFCQLSWHKLTSSLQTYTIAQKGDESNDIKENSIPSYSCCIFYLGHSLIRINRISLIISSWSLSIFEQPMQNNFSISDPFPTAFIFLISRFIS